jgi:ribose 5-phosphate isomerase B
MMTIHLGTDHAGFELKEYIKNFLAEKGHEMVIDHGAHVFNSEDDYPDFIKPVAQAVAKDLESRGIIFGASGQGEAMCANRIKGIRAAVWYGGDPDIVKLSREHNNANILSIGARFVSKENVCTTIEGWLTHPFEGGRHERRITKLDQE